MDVIKYILSLWLVTALTACGDGRPSDAQRVGEQPPIYPDYAGVTVPREIAPLNFDVEGADRVYVAVTGSKGGELTASGSYADFDIDQWHKLLEQNAGGTLTVDTYAKKDGKWLQYDPFEIHVSADPLDEWGLTYRRIAPGYEVYSTMGLYQRELSTFDETPLIENTMTGGQCYNCHTANRTNPDQMVFHIRGEHGGTMVQCEGQRKLLQATNDALGGAMVYPYWHPTGRYCAFSTNQTRQGFHIAGDKRLEVFDYSSDILVFDVESNTIITDSATAKPDWSENCPVFAPDGRSIYFITCKQKSYPLEYQDEQYNLCRVSFDPETGTLGTEVDTLFDAVAMGKSVTWPRPSYDGRHLMFTLSDYGYFSVWHKESDQWLLDLATGEARPLDALNSDDADSYHNWSVNSRWVVFTSRRADGLYTQLFLAHIGEDGTPSKPFLLPQRNPREYYGETLYSFNTPDFTSKPVELDARAAVAEILGEKRVPTNVKSTGGK